MKGDFTRLGNGHSKHYTGVLKQQGRVDLDSDWNEYVEIQERLRQTIEKDVIGACGVPKYGGGFAIGWDAGKRDLTISPGRIYVDGILCELENEESGNEITYGKQADFPNPPALQPVDGRTDLIYLDVWQRHITAIEDPEIREVALGGPDTTTRVQTVCQVKVLPDVGDVACSSRIPKWDRLIAPPSGRLSTEVAPTQPTENPCFPAPRGGYSGLENRLYRVEIHKGSSSVTDPGPPTFKWSRDNGSVVFPIQEFDPNDPTKITLTRLGKDNVLTLHGDDRVEVLGDGTELRGTPGTLTQIAPNGVDEARRVLNLKENVSAHAGEGHPKVRRWDQKSDPIPITSGAIPLDGEGISVRFSGGGFRIGDYWVFTARPATGVETLAEAPPQGIEHHYCRLATVTWRVSGDRRVTAEVQDCRKPFPPLTELPTGGSSSCCTVTVGDGVRSKGDFTDIQAAVDAVRGPGRVCILPGEYRLAKPVVIREKRGLVVSGCGIQARIAGPAEGPAFQVEGGLAIWLGSLYVEPRSRMGAITVNHSGLVYVRECLVSRERFLPESPHIERPDLARLLDVRERIFGARLLSEVEDGQDDRDIGPALSASRSAQMVVKDNRFLAGTPCLSLQARDLRVLQNVITGGGVWIRDGSSEVRVEDNEIGEGRGPGIRLGSLAEDEVRPEVATGVTGVDIVGNCISSMDDSGIAAAVTAGLGDVEDVEIVRNRIVGCAREQTGASSEFSAVGGIILNDATRVLIHENYIAENGESSACGVFANGCRGLEVTDNTIVENGTAQVDEPTCVDFREMNPGEGDNPRIEQGLRFTVFNGSAQTSIVGQPGGPIGLDCASRTEIDLPAPASSVELTLVVASVPMLPAPGHAATIEAFTAEGATVASEQISDAVGLHPQSFVLDGGNNSSQRISRVEIRVNSGRRVLLLRLCSSEQQSRFQGGIVALFASAVGPDKSRDASPGAQNPPHQLGAPAARIHDNAVLTPQGHALMLIAEGPVSVADNSLTSRGMGSQPEIPGVTDNEADQMTLLMDGGACVFVYEIGRSTLSSGTLSNLLPAPNSRRELATRPIAPFFNVVPSFFDRSLPEGRVLFHGNQVTLEARNNGPRPTRTIGPDDRPMKIGGGVAIFSFDDISLQDNQVLTEISEGLVFFDVATVAATVRASGNRFAEVPSGFTRTTLARYSYLSAGRLKNIATGNQATHCIGVKGPDTIERDNQILFNALCREPTQVEGRTDG